MNLPGNPFAAENWNQEWARIYRRGYSDALDRAEADGALSCHWESVRAERKRAAERVLARLAEASESVVFLAAAFEAREYLALHPRANLSQPPDEPIDPPKPANHKPRA